MKTKKGITFYLARENDVNMAFPVRMELKKGVSVMLKGRGEKR